MLFYISVKKNGSICEFFICLCVKWQWGGNDRILYFHIRSLSRSLSGGWSKQMLYKNMLDKMEKLVYPNQSNVHRLRAL